MTQKTSSPFTICHIFALEVNYFPVLLCVRALLARLPKRNKRKVVSGSRVTRSAYHLNGIFGNSGANSNGTVHPGGKFSEKRYLSRFYRNSRKFLYHLSTHAVPDSSR